MLHMAACNTQSHTLRKYIQANTLGYAITHRHTHTHTQRAYPKIHTEWQRISYFHTSTHTRVDERGPWDLTHGIHTYILYCIYSSDCILQYMHTLHAHTHTHRERRMRRSNESIWWDVQERFAAPRRLQPCGADLHDDGWVRKWQHKWLLKRGYGGIYKNCVSRCLRPMSHVTLGCCVMPPDLWDFPRVSM